MRVKCGLENIALIDGKLKNKRVGLMTHPCGCDSGLRSGIDIFNQNYRLTALFACEHGIRGDAQGGDHIENERDEETGVPVYSLYGETRVPTLEMMSEIDVLVVDLQDVGARFYTYLYSMTNAMTACAAAGKPIIVLDRVNPLGGDTVQGTLLNERFHSFVGEFAVPTRYALTIGEFALFAKAHMGIDVDLTVAPLTGWRRDMLWEDTGCVWTPPSPNIPSPRTALVYPGTCVFEGTNISEGRGTTSPFELIGAPFIDAARLEKRMRSMNIDGAGFMRASFTPTFSKWAHEHCHGVRVYALSREFDACYAALLLLETILDMYPNEARFLGDNDKALSGINLLLGGDEFRTGALGAKELIAKNKPLIEQFKQDKRAYHLY